jgi:hypothetical protein
MIAVSVYQSTIYGPYAGGYLEIKIFQEHIKTKIKQGKYAVANKGNKDSSNIMLALPNPVDFKACVLARHETVSGQIKHYNTMADMWNHGMDKHGIAILAVAATVQYKMDNGSERFPVFAASAANNITTV